MIYATFNIYSESLEFTGFSGVPSGHEVRCTIPGTTVRDTPVSVGIAVPVPAGDHLVMLLSYPNYPGFDASAGGVAFVKVP